MSIGKNPKPHVDNPRSQNSHSNLFRQKLPFLTIVISFHLSWQKIFYLTRNNSFKWTKYMQGDFFSLVPKSFKYRKVKLGYTAVKPLEYQV